MSLDDRLLDELCLVGRHVTRAGLVVGSGGNLSARSPGADRFWVTGAGTWLDRLDKRSFAEVLLDEHAGPVGTGPVGTGSGSGPAADPPRVGRVAPTSELALHLATYRARPDVNAIVHLHPQSVILLDALGERIRLVTTDHAFYVRQVARTPFYRPGTQALAEAAAMAVADGVNWVILAHHGCSVLGETVEMAHRRAANLEEAARLTYRALLLAGGLPGRDLAECPVDFGPADTV